MAIHIKQKPRRTAVTYRGNIICGKITNITSGLYVSWIFYIDMVGEKNTGSV